MKTVFVQIAVLFYWLIAFSAFGCLGLKAQEPALGWNLKQCIEYGLEHHRTNEIYRNNIEKARQLTKENVALYLPQIDASAYFDDNFELQTVIIPEGTEFPFQLPGGGTLGPIGYDARLQFGNKFVTTATIEAEQMLFNRQLLVSFRGLRPNMKVANLNFQQNQENIIYNITQAYISAHVLKQQMTLLAENEKKFTKQQEILKLQVEQGVAKKLDASRVSVALNNITSQLDIANGGYDVAINRLKNAMGMELTDSLSISDSTEITALNTAPDATFDVESKTEMQLQLNALKLQEVQKKRIGAGYFPTLSFYARYAAQAFNNEFAAAFGEWYDFSSIGLKLNVPIFDGMQKSAQRKQQIITMRNAEVNMELSRQGFQLQHQNAVLQLRRTKASMENNQENVTLAKDVFESMSLMHQQGAITLSEFLNAETAYKESQLNYITAMLNYYTAIVELEKAKGTLTQFYQKL